MATSTLSTTAAASVATMRRGLRSLLCGPGHARMPGRAPPGGAVCPHAASSGSRAASSHHHDWQRESRLAHMKTSRLHKRCLGGFRGCCAEVMQRKRVCPCSCTRVQLIEWASASELVPSAGLTSRNPYACCVRGVT